MSKEIDSISTIPWPNDTIQENFEFNASHSDGTFTFKFKWLDDERWHMWVTLPDGSVREASCYPNVLSWSGYLDYGIIVSTDLTAIGYDDLYMTELDLIKWK